MCVFVCVCSDDTWDQLYEMQKSGEPQHEKSFESIRFNCDNSGLSNSFCWLIVDLYHYIIIVKRKIHSLHAIEHICDNNKQL